MIPKKGMRDVDHPKASASEDRSEERARTGASGSRDMSNGSTPTHTLSVLVEDKPGVLARVASLFSRRGFNIESLAVGATEQKDMSRMTIVVSVEESPLEQITKQLNKLINVIKIVEQDDDNAVSRELALIKVRADATTRSQVIEAVNLFRAKVVDVTTESLTIEATGTPAKLEAFMRVLDPYGIRELAQSGVVSLSRGPRGIGTVK
jgi:acetolactate synthase I/III small subunit